MTVTINNIRAQFHLNPPLITFMQGCDMSIPSIRDTLRQIEESEEGRSQPFPQIVTASGNQDFSELQDGSIMSALTIRVLTPYTCDFEAGPLPFSTDSGNILFTAVSSPGAIVKINNAVGSMLVSSGGSIPTATEIASEVWNTQMTTHRLSGSAGSDILSASLGQSTPIDYQEVATSVWNEPLTNYASGSAGYTVMTVEQKTSNISGTLENGVGLSPSQSMMLLEMYRLLGLDPTLPLVISTTNKKVPVDGSIINQTITKVGQTATIQRV